MQAQDHLRSRKHLSKSGMHGTFNPFDFLWNRKQQQRCSSCLMFNDGVDGAFYNTGLTCFILLHEKVLWIVCNSFGHWSTITRLWYELDWNLYRTYAFEFVQMTSLNWKLGWYVGCVLYFTEMLCFVLLPALTWFNWRATSWHISRACLD